MWLKTCLINVCALNENAIVTESVNLILQVVEDANVVENLVEIDAWIMRDIEAMSIIFYNIEPLYQTSIEGSTTSNEMWNRLQLEYANVAIANSNQLLGKFYQYRMDPGNSKRSQIV